MKIVLDSMMWVSYATHADGRRAKVIERAIRSRVRLFVSDWILDEVARVLAQRMGLSRRFANLALEAIDRRTTHVELPENIPVFVPGDRDDNPIIQTALSASADYVVTADKVLLALRQVHAVRIIDLDELNALLPPEE